MTFPFSEIKLTKDSYLISRYEDYTTEIEEIKKLLAEIWNIPYGITIYAKHNRKAFVQLRILELLLSDNIGHIQCVHFIINSRFNSLFD